MCYDNFLITKRDGTTERFSLEKIKSAILKAFESVSEHVHAEDIQRVMDNLRFCNGMSVEDIQNQVEIALMRENHYKAAKSFMLYRQKHFEDREIRNKLKFLIDYCKASNPATGSKYDANANVENKNIATLIGELPKSNFIRLNRRLLCEKKKEMNAKEIPHLYLYLHEHHFK